MNESGKGFLFVPAGKMDIPLALNFRRILFDEMGVPDNSLIDNCYDILFKLYQEEFEEGRIQHFIAYNGEHEPVAIAGALLKTDFPYYLFKPGYYGWIIDVYTVPKYRGRKLASQLLELTQQWLVAKGVQEAKLIAAGSAARRLYERLGYRATWEMSVNLSGNKTYNEFIDLKKEP
ncbi:MAG: GNAT family N-acetyltransferase [Candidatus Contendobacter sp.]